MGLTTRNNDTATSGQPARTGGWRFGIPAAVPGLYVVGYMAAAASASTLATAAFAAVAGMGALAAGVVSAAYDGGPNRAFIGFVSGVAAAGAVAVPGLGGIVIAIGAIGAAVLAGVTSTHENNSKTVFASVLGGAALSAALTYGAIENDTPAPVEKPQPVGTLQMDRPAAQLTHNFAATAEGLKGQAARQTSNAQDYRLAVTNTPDLAV